jgi:ATP-dependent protease HslVU (ClpYQ) peptidase subunit
MTTIIGIQGDGWSMLGADSKISSLDDDGYVTAQLTLPKTASKIAQRGDYLLGAAGDVRAINLLHHVYEPPSTRYATTPEKLNEHVTKRVIPTLRQCFDDQGFSPPDKSDRDHKAEHNSTVIISVKGRIYVIESDYSWVEDTSGIYVLGTGSPYARAALHALIGQHSSNKLNQKRALSLIERALEITSAHDVYTGGAFHIFIQEGPDGW